MPDAKIPTSNTCLWTRRSRKSTLTRPLERGLEARAIGRSRGGLTTRIHAAADALGLPIRVGITAGQWGECPQARGLIEGLEGVGHVIADAAHDADHLREFITDTLGSTAQFKQNPTRSGARPIDWTLYKERHLRMFQPPQMFPPDLPALRENGRFLPKLRRTRMCDGMARLNEDAA